MRLWDRIKNTNKAEHASKASQAQNTTPPDFDYKAGYERAVTHLDLINRNLIAATEGLKLARDMAVSMMEEAKEIKIESIEGPYDGAVMDGYIITRDCHEAFELCINGWEFALNHIQRTMGGLAVEELKDRITSPLTDEATRQRYTKILSILQKQKVGKA